jgi:hypothetical protein
MPADPKFVPTRKSVYSGSCWDKSNHLLPINHDPGPLAIHTRHLQHALRLDYCRTQRFGFSRSKGGGGVTSSGHWS